MLRNDPFTVLLSMHIAAVITLCFSATLGAGFLLAGLVALLSLDDADRQRYQEKVAEARRVGGWKEYWAIRDVLPLSQVVSHWRTRPESRRLIWIGLAFGIVTLVAAFFI